MITTDSLRLKSLVTEWHEAGRAEFTAQYQLLDYDKDQVKRINNRAKYIALDVGSSGAWLVDKQDGMTYHIKSKYGVPDKTKCLGHIDSITGEQLHTYRWWYVR
jgi:hypothetical protein